jgi:hypothetical protein
MDGADFQSVRLALAGFTGKVISKDRLIVSGGSNHFLSVYPF